jgi:excisionase family DNA binding protein
MVRRNREARRNAFDDRPAASISADAETKKSTELNTRLNRRPVVNISGAARTRSVSENAMKNTPKPGDRPEYQVHDPFTYGVADTCGLTGLKRTTIYKLLKNKTLDHVKVGSRTLITAASIKRLINGEA